MAWHAGLDSRQICSGLETFTGVDRRMTYRATVAGVTIVDDYAHHPTEIQASLEAISRKYRPRRLWTVFQPHQHSRTRFLLHEFAASFRHADVVLLPDIYFVRESEQQRKEINAEMLARLIDANGQKAYYLKDFDGIIDTLCRELQPNDLVVTMGAGDIWKLADELIRRLAGHSNGK